MVKKIKTVLTVIVFISLIAIFVDANLHREAFSEKYGFKPETVTAIFIIAEVAFNIGIVLMLKGLGIFKMKLRDILKFDFTRTKFESSTFLWGFILNRLAAAFPWIYVLGVGWKNLPMALTGLITLELLMVLIITIGIREVTYDYQKS